MFRTGVREKGIRCWRGATARLGRRRDREPIARPPGLRGCPWASSSSVYVASAPIQPTHGDAAGQTTTPAAAQATMDAARQADGIASPRRPNRTLEIGDAGGDADTRWTASDETRSSPVRSPRTLPI